MRGARSSLPAEPGNRLHKGRWIDDSEVAVGPEQMDAYDWRGETMPVAPPRSPVSV